MPVGNVYLVGAGPGDPELLTIRGRRRLATADVVLYDALVHPELLEHCAPHAERVFVGKRAGQASERQKRINERMIAEARAGRTVVRLKGGDPYLFGRGSEEAEALAAAAIPFEVIPGVPSPLAATAYAGISLTHRELASSVAYVTATESPEKDRSSHDWSRLATATQTLVIFMGMKRLGALMALLVEHGRAPETPAAVVQWASLPTQRTVVGTVGTIAELASEAGLGLPSLVIIGDVVRLRQQLRWFDARPLFGVSVAVTRPADQADELVVALRDAGAEPVRAPAIRTVPSADDAPLREAASQLHTYDWVLFTSRNAVSALFAALGGRDARAFGGARVLAIGQGTAAELAAHGVRPDLVAAEARGEGALAALRGAVHGPTRMLLPRAEEAREVLPEGLRADGHDVDVVTAYRTVGPDDAMRTALLAAASADAFTFTSPSTFAHTVEVIGTNALAGKPIACIGGVTADAIRLAGIRDPLVAHAPSMAALVSALETYYAKRS